MAVKPDHFALQYTHLIFLTHETCPESGYIRAGGPR